MEVLYPHCAGLDVHQQTVVACARIATEEGVAQQVETFETTTQGLERLRDWLATYGCTHVAMESTGVYWKPVWHVLEGSFALVLAHAAHIRNVPGRKSDVNDAMWIADLLAHGLIRGSFVPPTPVQELRDLTRTRKQLVREVAQHTQRLQKTLEDANIKITGVISDILGQSGRALLQALIAGETDPERLVQLTTGRLKAPRAVLVEALRGRVRPHHRFLLKLHLDQIDALQAAVREVEARIGESTEPYRAAVELLDTIPGVNPTAAHVILGEIGLDMARFPTAAHLISWAGLCPRNDESAGKRRSTRVRKGAPWLKTTLVQAAWAAVRTKGSYLRAQFLRIKARRGPMKAILAVAASMLTAAYHMLRTGAVYEDLGELYFDTRDRLKLVHRLVRRLGDLGVRVELKEAAA
jgi:transposase